ncbi:hypothetical protein H5T87_01985 [bacterium]|nr:hypothetical protein [bacterium]
MPCPNCNREIEKGLLICPHCQGELNPPIEDCLERVITLMDEDRKDEAMEYLKEVVNRYPQNASAHSLLASLYEEAHDYPSAIHHYRVAVELNPESTAERRKLELLTGEKYSLRRFPLLPPALALLGILFVILVVYSIPQRKPSSTMTNSLTNIWEYPPYNQWQMPYYYTNQPYSAENIPAPSVFPSNQPSPTTLPSARTNQKPPSQNEKVSLPPLAATTPAPQPQTPVPYTNIIIQPTTPQSSQPKEKKGRIFIEVKRASPSFDDLYSRAMEKFHAKDFAESERLLKLALSLAPDNKKGEVHFSLALALKEQAKWQEAIYHFSQAEQYLAGRSDPLSQQLLQQAKEGKAYCEEKM